MLQLKRRRNRQRRIVSKKLLNAELRELALSALNFPPQTSQPASVEAPPATPPKPQPRCFHQPVLDLRQCFTPSRPCGITRVVSDGDVIIVHYHDGVVEKIYDDTPTDTFTPQVAKNGNEVRALFNRFQNYSLLNRRSEPLTSLPDIDDYEQTQEAYIKRRLCPLV